MCHRSRTVGHPAKTLRRTDAATYALQDVVRRRLPGSLADSARLLRHKDFRVRIIAAQTMAAFGAEARPYLDDLRRAAEAETDDITRRTMLGSISVIEKATLST